MDFKKGDLVTVHPDLDLGAYEREVGYRLPCTGATGEVVELDGEDGVVTVRLEEPADDMEVTGRLVHDCPFNAEDLQHRQVGPHSGWKEGDRLFGARHTGCWLPVGDFDIQVYYSSPHRGSVEKRGWKVRFAKRTLKRVHDSIPEAQVAGDALARRVLEKALAALSEKEK